MTTFDHDIFQMAATDTLPEALCRQLEPYTADLLERYERFRDAEIQAEFYQSRDRDQRYASLRREFQKHSASDWIVFARERWPEIDRYFDLERKNGKEPFDDDIPI